MREADWSADKTLAVALEGRLIEDGDGNRLLLLLNAHDEPVTFTVPHGRAAWRVVLTTDDLHPVDISGTVIVTERSFLLLEGS